MADSHAPGLLHTLARLLLFRKIDDGLLWRTQNTDTKASRAGVGLTWVLL